MFKNIYLKSLYEKRWGMLLWGLAIFATTLLVMLVFPMMRDSFGQQLEAVPESLKALVGEASDYQRITGFVELQVLAQMMFFTIIYGIILGVSLISGDEAQGTLQTLLAQPVSRSRVYWQKLAAMVTILTIVSALIGAGILVGAAILNEPIGITKTIEASFMQLLLALLFSVGAFAIGAATGKRAIAGTVAGVYAFAGYMITGLAGISEIIEKLNYASPFRYFMGQRTIEVGILARNFWPLFLATIMLALIGWFFFTRRNVYQ